MVSYWTANQVKSLTKRKSLLNLIHSVVIKTLILNETWPSSEVTNEEVFLGDIIKIIVCSDSLYEEHGGVLIASPVFSDLNDIDLSLEQYPFTKACALLNSLSVSFFDNV